MSLSGSCQRLRKRIDQRVRAMRLGRPQLWVYNLSLNRGRLWRISAYAGYRSCLWGFIFSICVAPDRICILFYSFSQQHEFLSLYVLLVRMNKKRPRKRIISLELRSLGSVAKLKLYDLSWTDPYF